MSTFIWRHVCRLANWTTVWIQNADTCPCGKKHEWPSGVPFR